jgi:hypothetical protein
MKFAHFDFYFVLPNDFDGGIDDILNMIITYRSIIKEKKETSMSYVEELKNSKTISKAGYDELMYNKFIKSAKEDGTRLFGDMRVLVN